MLFADDIVLIDETHSSLNDRLEMWRETLKAKGFKLSRTKREYLECKLSEGLHEEGVEVCLDSQALPKSDLLKHLGSIIQGSGVIGSDGTHRIGAAWMK